MVFLRREKKIDQQAERSPWSSGTTTLKKTYGLSVCALLIFVFFNVGFRPLFLLTVRDLFKVHLDLEPVEAQYFMSILALPCAIKIIIGIFVDNFKYFKSSRNIYEKISGMMMSGSLVWLQISIFRGKYVALTLLIILIFLMLLLIL